MSDEETEETEELVEDNETPSKTTRGGTEIWHPHTVTFFGPETRSIMITGEITEETAASVCSQVLELESLSNVDPIVVYINTPGGDISQGLAIYDVLRSVECPIITFAVGQCASAGLLLLCAGDLRMATQHTMFFYHQPVTQVVGIDSSADMLSFADHYQYGKKILEKLMRQRCGMSKKVWKREFGDSTSRHFSAKTALKFNFIDQYTMPANKNLEALEVFL